MNQKEYELIADVLYQQREMIGGNITEIAFRKIVRDFSGALARTNKLYDANKFQHVAGWCPEYNEQSLPNEQGNCSLCNKYKV